MKRIFIPLAVLVLSGCTFSNSAGQAGAGASAAANASSSTTGTIIIEKMNEKGQVIERHRVEGGAGQQQRAEAEADANAVAKSTNRSVSTLVIIGIVVAAIAAILGAAELTKLIARWYGGTGL